MNCLACGTRSKVIDSRLTNFGQDVRRRRLCSKCKSRWSTVERVLAGSFKAPKRQKPPKKAPSFF